MFCDATIVDRLLTDTSLTSLIGTRLTPDILPVDDQGTALLPAVVYTTNNVEPVRSLDLGNTGRCRVEYQFDVWSVSAKEGETIADLIRTRLDNWSGNNVEEINFEQQSRLEDFDGFHCVQHYTIRGSDSNVIALSGGTARITVTGDEIQICGTLEDCDGNPLLLLSNTSETSLTGILAGNGSTVQVATDLSFAPTISTADQPAAATGADSHGITIQTGDAGSSSVDGSPGGTGGDLLLRAGSGGDATGNGGDDSGGAGGNIILRPGAGGQSNNPGDTGAVLVKTADGSTVGVTITAEQGGEVVVPAGVVSALTVISTASLQARSNSVGDIPLTVTAASGQTGDLQRWDSFNGTVLSKITSNGTFTGPGSGITNLNGSNISSGTVADARLSSNLPLKNAANTFSTGPQVLVGGATVRQSGGTAGTDEVQVTHDGTRTIIDSKDGLIRFSAPYQTGVEFRENTNGKRGAYVQTTAGGYVGIIDSNDNEQFSIDCRTLPAVFGVASGSLFAWSNNTNASWQTKDTALARPAAKVIELNNGTAGGAGGTLRSVPLTPAQITADQNDYAPGVARFYRLSSDASRNITGLSISQVDGQEFTICNVGSNNVVLKHQSTSSTAANRFICGGADITLAADEQALAWYDGTTGRFRVRKI